MTKYIVPPGSGGCRTGKVQFGNRSQAKRAARKLNDSALAAYRCPHCDWFHIGHKPQRVRNGEVDKADWLNATRPKRRPRKPGPRQETTR